MEGKASSVYMEGKASSVYMERKASSVYMEGKASSVYMEGKADSYCRGPASEATALEKVIFVCMKGGPVLFSK